MSNIVMQIMERAKERGISRYKISKDTGISQVALLRYIKGDVIPGIDKVEKIAEAVGVEIIIKEKGS